MRARADEAEMLLIGKQNLLHTATLTGNVHVERIGSQPMQGDAGRAILDFRRPERIEKSACHRRSPSVATPEHHDRADHERLRNAPLEPQDFDLTAPTVDFFVADGNRLDHAETSGAAQITISPAQNSNPATEQASAHTVVTAGRFDAKFAATRRRLKPPDVDPRRARREDCELHSAATRPRQHQPDARCPVSAAGRNRLHHSEGKCGLRRRPGPQQTHASLGGQSGLHSRRPHPGADGQPARVRGQHGDHGPTPSALTAPPMTPSPTKT